MSDLFSNPNEETEFGESLLAYQDIPIFSDKKHNSPVSQEGLEAIMDDDAGFENSLAVENQATKHSSDEPYSSYTEEKPYIEDDQTDTQEQIDDCFDEDEAYADSIRIPPETSNNEGEQSPSLPPRSRSKKQTSETANVSVYTPLSLAQN